jgi:hypothetical protein
MIRIFSFQVSTSVSANRDRILIVPDIWFHRYEEDDKGVKHDIEGRCRSTTLSHRSFAERS